MPITAPLARQVAGLLPDELARFERDGLVIPRTRLPETICAEMRTALDETLLATAGTPPESLVCPHIPMMSGVPERVAQKWLSFAALPEILDRVESAIGRDIVLWGAQVFCKPAATGMEVPWHQDGEYWPIRPLATCSAWIAIDDVDVENGAMSYIPGSHRARELFAHLLSGRDDLALNRVLDPDCFDPGLARYDELRAGEFSLHDVYLVHGSAANRSKRRRAGFVARFMPASSHFDRSLSIDAGSKHFQTRFAERPIFLMRGDARSNMTNLVDSRGLHA